MAKEVSHTTIMCGRVQSYWLRRKGNVTSSLFYFFFITFSSAEKAEIVAGVQLSLQAPQGLFLVDIV